MSAPTTPAELAAMLERGIAEVESSGHLVYVKLTPAEARLCLAAISAQPVADEIRQARELAKLAYRALDDAARVLWMIDPESADEGEHLRELTERCASLAVSIFTITRLPPGAMPHMAGVLTTPPKAGGKTKESA